MSKHATRKDCPRQVLGWRYKDYNSFHQQASSNKAWVRLTLWEIVGHKATISHFRVFSCVCYWFVSSHLGTKFDKKALGVSLWATTVKEKGGDAAIPLAAVATHHVVWCLMKHLRGGHHRRRSFPIRKKSTISCNRRWESKSVRYDQLLRWLVTNLTMKTTATQRQTSPWWNGVHQRHVEESDPSQGTTTPQSQLRRLTIVRKLNPKYTNAVVVEETNLK